VLFHDAFLTSAKYGSLDLRAARVRMGRTLLSAAFDFWCGAGASPAKLRFGKSLIRCS